jgi:hypothetical protein
MGSGGDPEDQQIQAFHVNFLQNALNLIKFYYILSYKKKAKEAAALSPQ